MAIIFVAFIDNAVVVDQTCLCHIAGKAQEEDPDNSHPRPQPDSD